MDLPPSYNEAVGPNPINYGVRCAKITDDMIERAYNGLQISLHKHVEEIFSNQNCLLSKDQIQKKILYRLIDSSGVGGSCLINNYPYDTRFDWHQWWGNILEMNEGLEHSELTARRCNELREINNVFKNIFTSAGIEKIKSLLETFKEQNIHDFLLCNDFKDEEKPRMLMHSSAYLMNAAVKSHTMPYVIMTMINHQMISQDNLNKLYSIGK